MGLGFGLGFRVLDLHSHEEKGAFPEILRDEGGRRTFEQGFAKIKI